MIELSDDLQNRLTYAVSNASQFTLGVSSTRIFSVNKARLLAIIVNDSANKVYLSLGASATSGLGILLTANGGSFTFGLCSDFPWLGEVCAIADGAGSNITIVEV